MARIEIEKLTKYYGDKMVLDGVDLSVEPHEVVCLIGASGSGKSTLLRCINGITEFDDGSVRIDGVDIYDETFGRTGLYKKVGIVFQAYNLFPHMTVLQNVTLAPITDTDEASDEVRPVGRFLYEPDDAVIRAGLVTAVAAGVGGGLVDRHLAYVTSDASFVTPFARSYEVLEELPHRERALREALRSRGVGSLTIKKRGVEVVPEELRKRLALSGEQEATIVLTRAAGKGVCWLVRPFGDR
jgi:ABC-type Fe3+/spermidine/putrescine transport system ATPase subunit